LTNTDMCVETLSWRETNCRFSIFRGVSVWRHP
jgi:hypothetical protein